MIEPLVLTEKQTALTDSQWDAIKDLFDCRRKRKHAIRGIINAILYVVHNDIHWRMLPKSYAPWQTVYYYFDKWRKTGVWQRVLETLPNDIRQKAMASSFVSPYPTVDLKIYQATPQPRRAKIHTVEAGSSLTPEQRQARRYAWVLRDFIGSDDDSPHNQAA
ncbi:MAG: transposase [Bacteroidota bacterium]